MRFFIIKVLGILTLSGTIFLVILFVLPQLRRPKYEISEEFVNKIDQADIIICGDSRADRQLDPAVIYRLSHLKTLNIASSSGELYTFSNYLKESRVSNKIIIISASFFQFNDGAIDFGYFDLDSYNDLSFLEKVRMYYSRPSEFILMQSRSVQESLDFNSTKVGFGNYRRKINEDFDRQPCRGFEINKRWFNDHPWYKSLRTDGVKRKLLVKGLYNLSTLSKCKIFVYNGPVSEVFSNLAKSNGIYELEKSYDNFMQTECEKNGIVYHSFLQDTSIRESNLYYDPQHLCGDGISIFSTEIIKLLHDYKIIVGNRIVR